MPKPFMVAVGGGSGSGKTTVVSLLRARCPDIEILVLAQDHYYRDLSHLSPAERAQTNFDTPEAFDTELLLSHLALLAAGGPVDRPTYDFVTHTRLPTRIRLEATPVVVLDGIMSLADARVRALCDLTIYIDVADDIRFIRRLTRDTRERGRTMESVVSQYLASVKPMHDLHVAPTKHLADLVVNWDIRHERTIDMLVDLVRKKVMP